MGIQEVGVIGDLPAFFGRIEARAEGGKKKVLASFTVLRFFQGFAALAPRVVALAPRLLPESNLQESS